MTDRTPRSRPFVLAVLSALLLVFAQQPYGAWPLAFFAIVPLALLAEMDEAAAPRRYLAAYLGGFVHFFVGCFWLRHTHPANLVMMTLPEAFAFPLYVYFHRTLRAFRLPIVFAVPCAFVAVEWLRAHGPFNGFPWLLLGYALATPIELPQAAEWGGVFYLTFLAALANGFLVLGWRCRPVKAVAIACLFAAFHVPFLLYVYGKSRIPEIEARESTGPTVVAIQANIAQDLKQELKRDHADPMSIFDRHVDLTKKAVADRDVDLVVWPETMFPWTLGKERESEAERDGVKKLVIERVLQPVSAHLLLGAVTVDGDHVYSDPTRNAAVLYGLDGKRMGVYAKTVLVPGGEYIPLYSLLKPIIDPVVLSIAPIVPQLTAGDGPTVFSIATGDGVMHPFGTTICYENVYPDYCAKIARGVEFVVNLSNEAWFKDSGEFDQMEAASRLRAIESRRSLVRATNSGISALYDATGKRLAVLTDEQGRDREIPGFLKVQVPICAEETVFSRRGSAPFAVLSAIVAISSLLREFVRRYRRLTAR